MDASQGPQLFGEIPAGGTVVQGQQGPVFRRRHGPGEKQPLGRQSMVQYTCGRKDRDGRQENVLPLHGRTLLS